MSIATEITRLQGVKADILSAISNKGVIVPTGSKLDDCPELIAAISGGGGADVSKIRVQSGTFNGELLGNDIIYGNGYAVFTTSPLNLNFNDFTSWEIRITVKMATGSFSSGNPQIGLFSPYSTNYIAPGLQLNSGGSSPLAKGFWVGIPDDTALHWVSNYFLVGEEFPLHENRWYSIRLRYDGSKYYLEYSQNLSEWSLVGAFEIDVAPLYRSCSIRFGGNYSGSYGFKGHIDLKNTFIKGNGELVYGCDYGVMPTA